MITFLKETWWIIRKKETRQQRHRRWDQESRESYRKRTEELRNRAPLTPQQKFRNKIIGLFRLLLLLTIAGILIWLCATFKWVYFIVVILFLLFAWAVSGDSRW